MSFVPVPALSSALQGLTSNLRRFDRAAAVVARLGLTSPSEPPEPPGLPPSEETPPPEPGQPTDLTGTMTEILIAQRGYFAQLRLIEAAQKTDKEAIDLGRTEE